MIPIIEFGTGLIAIEFVSATADKFFKRKRSKPKKKCFGASNALTMRCDEKFRLVMECTEAAEKYSDSVLDLNAKSGVSAHEEYTEQKRVVDDCRAALELARLALDRHISIHGCGRADEFLN